MTAELRATFRLQLTSEFGFEDVRGLIPYLRDLGISHLYLSPSLQARSGSTHGYDVIDPSRLSESLGGEENFRILARDAGDAGMGILIDVVPNHMAADEENRYWADESLREQFFDLDHETGRWRRFFDIDELAALRQEDPEVFEATHALVLRLVRDGLIDGLRVDHPDGLADPAGYFERLRTGGAGRVWVEKILDPGEKLRDWAVSGTVGYEFLNDACALFVDRSGEAPMTRLWEKVSGDPRPFGEVALEAKLEQAHGTFAPEVQRLLAELGTKLPLSQDELARALSALAVYRTYVEAGRGMVAEEDRAALATADLPSELAQALLLEREVPAAFVTRFQQTTPAIMAKGVEDTAFYRYCRLLALNDVGGDPSRFGIGIERFHEGCLERAARFPLNLLTTQTHDAKRSADVRARIGVLASVPAAWEAFVERAFELTQPLVCGGAPDDVERYFLLQTLVGAWPIESERLGAYMEKALREAKRNTNWVEPSLDWEQAVQSFIDKLYKHPPFVAELESFIERIAPAGERAALGQLVLKLTTPGVPDIYQGDELEYRALVDPDNRRAVDWQYHQSMLGRLMGGSRPVQENRKMFLIMRLLGLRGRRPEQFAGAYEPLEAGPAACAFARGESVLVVVGLQAPGRRLCGGGTLLGAPRGRWRNVLNGEERCFDSRQPLRPLFGDLSVLVYERL
ncbi:MAG: malto-oligosyltrehalose synthase [Solirubrobacteraceae bacterium]